MLPPASDPFGPVPSGRPDAVAPVLLLAEAVAQTPAELDQAVLRPRCQKPRRGCLVECGRPECGRSSAVVERVHGTTRGLWRSALRDSLVSGAFVVSGR